MLNLVISQAAVRHIPVQSNKRVKILDISGRVIKSDLNVGKIYYIGELSEGMYFIEIEKDSIKYTSKILIQK
jgi:hypothetical protein